MEEELDLQVEVDDIDEVSSQVEHITLEDLSFSLEEDVDVASEAIGKTLVGRFLAKRPISNSLLRAVMGKVWRPKIGWKMQEVSMGIFIFRFTRKTEAEFILENGPWSPCDGFLLLKPMPPDGLWRSADLYSTPIWVRACGFPMSFITDQNAAKVASRFAKVHEINPTHRNGMMQRDYLRFKVDIRLDSPIQAGFSLPRLNAPRIWIFFKYERLPITCFKCGFVGHVKQACEANTVKIMNAAGKMVDLYGPWLRVGHRLDHCFSALTNTSRRGSRLEVPRQENEELDTIRLANPEAYRVPEVEPETRSGGIMTEQTPESGDKAQTAMPAHTTAPRMIGTAITTTTTTSLNPEAYRVPEVEPEMRNGGIMTEQNPESGDKAKAQTAMPAQTTAPRTIGTAITTTTTTSLTTMIAGTRDCSTTKDRHMAKKAGTAVAFNPPIDNSKNIFGAADVADLATLFKGALDPNNTNKAYIARRGKGLNRPKNLKTIRPTQMNIRDSNFDGLVLEEGSRKRKKPIIDALTETRLWKEFPADTSPKKSRIGETVVQDPSEGEICTRGEDIEKSRNNCKCIAGDDEPKADNAIPNQGFGEAEEAGLIMPPRPS
ncbi:Zinc finger, CCHC-type [Trema orientale]|uniref:Zinc finger, CCHC-type n=1 Tax=Trema orientale TaxID=63057 RepID=A0A2P5AD31_TREOI|nr:Zinc finger, CCHC-type [Trema orientale]